MVVVEEERENLRQKSNREGSSHASNSVQHSDMAKDAEAFEYIYKNIYLNV